MPRPSSPVHPLANINPLTLPTHAGVLAQADGATQESPPARDDETARRVRAMLNFHGWDI